MNDPSLDDSQSVAIAVAPNEVVAQMWQELLRSEGIIAALKPAGAGHSFATPALFEHYVLVLSDQADRARAIIDDFESADDVSSNSSEV